MKKGFTLIELIAVITIIGIITMITVPAVGSVINSSKDKAYEKQIEHIKNAARTYMAKNSKELPNDGEKKCLAINELKQAGLLTNSDIKNPKKSDENIEGYIIITFTSNKYKYEYNENNTCL